MWPPSFQYIAAYMLNLRNHLLYCVRTEVFTYRGCRTRLTCLTKGPQPGTSKPRCDTE